MLNAMREGTKSGFIKFFLFSFMVLAVGGLVMTDVGGFFRGGVSRNNIAKINGQELPVAVFDRTMRRILSNQGLDIQTAYHLGFINQILSNEISGNLIQQAARDMGLEVDNSLVLKQVSKLIEPLVTKDMNKKAALTAVLRRQGMTEQGFVHMIKAEMTNRLLKNALQIGTEFAPQKEALDLYQHKNEKRTLKVVFLPHKNIKDVTKPTDEVLLPFYKIGKERYTLPETRIFSMAFLSQDKLKKTMDVEENKLRAIYKQDIETFTLPERRVLEQAIFETQDIATAVRNRMNEKTSLKEAVTLEMKKADSWLGTETFEKEGLLKNISTAAFSAAKGDIIGPIKTELGWHIIKVKEVIPPSIQTFEDIKDGLKKEIIQNQLADEMFALSNDIDDSLAGGLSLEEVVNNMDLTLKQYGPVKADGATLDKTDGTKDFKEDQRAVLETVFELMEGETSPVMELADGRYAVIRTDVIAEKAYKDFDTVKESLGALWIQDQKEVGNKLKAQEALKALNAGKKNLKQIALSNNMDIETYTLVRGDTPPDTLNSAVKTLFFALPESGYGIGHVKDGLVIGQVTNIELPNTKEIKTEDLTPFIDTLQKSAQDEILQLYFKTLQSAYNVKINQRLLEQTYGPGHDQF